MNHQPCEHEIEVVDTETATGTTTDSHAEEDEVPSSSAEINNSSEIPFDDKSDKVSSVTDVTVISRDGSKSPETERTAIKKREKSNETPSRQVPLKRSNTSLNSKSLTLSKVNCKEKIILCIDNSLSMFTSIFKRTVQSIKQKSVFSVLIGALKQFIMTKSFINKKHEYSLMLLDENAQLISQFLDQGSEVVYRLQEICDNSQITEEDKNETPKDFDLSSLFDMIDDFINVPLHDSNNLPPPYIVRVILVFGRSRASVSFEKGKKSFKKLCQNPYFFTDCVYIHEEPDENNNVTEIFSALCDLDENGSSYMLEASVDGSMSSLYNAFAKLCAHPLQRTHQLSAQDLDIFSAS